MSAIYLAIIIFSIVLPTLLLNIAPFFAFRFLFRRLFPGRKRLALRCAVGALIGVLAAGYGYELWKYERAKRWAASETIPHAQIHLSESDSVFLSTTGCTEACAALLVKGGVGSVVTLPPSVFIDGIGKPDDTMRPFVRWTLVRDPTLCGSEKAQQAAWKIGRFKALLAQGYCFRDQAVQSDGATYTLRKRHGFPRADTEKTIESSVKREDRIVWSIIDQAGRILTQTPRWNVEFRYWPPGVTAFGDFLWLSRELYRGPTMISTFIAQAFGISFDDLSTGPVLVDDADGAIMKAARSPSFSMQMSALALICARGQDKRGESLQALEILARSPDARVVGKANLLLKFESMRWPCTQI